MTAYVDFVGAICVSRIELDENTLREIGDFTRENIAAWLNGNHADWHNWIGVTPVEDFHAVCGDVDIPWATDNAKQVWNEVRKAGERAHAINSGKLKPWD